MSVQRCPQLPIKTVSVLLKPRRKKRGKEFTLARQLPRKVLNELLAFFIPLLREKAITIHIHILPSRRLPAGVECHRLLHEFGMPGRMLAIGGDGRSNLSEKGGGLPGPVADVKPVIQIRTVAHLRQAPGGTANDDIAKQRGLVVHQSARLKP